MAEKILLIGGGGHCRACIDVIEARGGYEIGIVEKQGGSYEKIPGYKVAGFDADIPTLLKEYKNILVVIGQIKDSAKRKAKFDYIKELGGSFPVIVSPHAYVSGHSEVGEGTIVMHGAFINSGARIGRNCIINTSAVIEHDAVVGDHCHISTGTVVNGACRVGEGVFVGSNAVLSHDVELAAGTVIGAGAVVVNSIMESGVYCGNPARRL